MSETENLEELEEEVVYPKGFAPGAPPNVIFKVALENPDWDAKKWFIPAYWQMLELACRPGNTTLNLTLADRLRFDFGLWGGEQLGTDPEVKEVVQELQEEVDTPYQLVYQECTEELSAWSVDAPITTLTGWFMNRYQTYSLMAEAEDFKFPEEILAMMPENSNRFIQLRNKRKTRLKSLEAFFRKVPGYSDSVIQPVVSGAIHDQLDVMLANRFSNTVDRAKLKQPQTFWQGLSTRLKEVFKHDKVQKNIEHIDEDSKELQSLMIKHNLDFRKVLAEARQQAMNSGFIDKKLAKDYRIIKEKLLEGASNRAGMSFDPFVREWPKPIDPEELKELRQRALDIDRSTSSRLSIVFAPGSFRPFYIRERGIVVISIYSSNLKEDLADVLAQRHLAMKEVNDEEGFLEDLQAIVPEGSSVPETFSEIYAQWFDCAKESPDEGLGPEALNFCIKHIAPRIENLFLREEDSKPDRTQQKNLLTLWKKNKVQPNLYKALINVFFMHRLNKEALGLLEKITTLIPDRPEIEVALGYCHHRMGNAEASEDVLKKWANAKNRGYYAASLKVVHESEGQT